MDPRKRWSSKTLIVLFCIIVVFVGIAALFFKLNFVRQYAGSVTARLTMGERPINILLIANNARGVAADDPLGLGTAAGQADVILLARLDPGAHEIYAITIPRDTLFAQPHWHNSVPKIKTLFFMGDQETPPRGPQYLVKAVSDLTGLPIDGYIVANFAGFKDAVDLVGGLTIHVKARIYDPQFSGADFQPGVQLMNGAQTLAFIRVRQNQAGNSYRVNDYQRMQAEVQVLGILRNTLLDPARATSLIPKFTSKMKRDIATNLSQDRLIRIGIAMAGAPVFQVPLGSIADSMELAPAQIPGINADGAIDGADYVVLDPADVKRRLAEFGSRSATTGLQALPAPKSLHIDLYGSAHMALHLEHLGFRHVKILGGPTDSGRVIYPPSFPAAGWEAAQAVGGGSLYVEPGNVRSVTVYE